MIRRMVCEKTDDEGTYHRFSTNFDFEGVCPVCFSELKLENPLSDFIATMKKLGWRR